MGAVHAVRRMLLRIPYDVRRERQHADRVCDDPRLRRASDACLRMAAVSADEEVGKRGED